ncbi:MAG: transposase [Nanoarchaeota archaeon]
MYCGIDVSKNKSNVCILDKDRKIINEFEIEHTKEGLEKLKQNITKDTKIALEVTGNYSKVVYNNLKDDYEYDMLGRVIRINNSDLTYKNVSYNHWNVTIYDENQNRKDYQTDAYGNILTVLEFNNTQTYVTRYRYNAANELVLIVDSLGNQFNYTYDSSGKKIKDIDPDRGTWNYTYDSVGNLIGQEDNRDKVTEFKYDSLNRKFEDKNVNENISYVYDINKKLTLGLVLAPSMNMSYTYDDRLRKITENKTIDGFIFAQTLSYDSADRVLTKSILGTPMINFTYDVQGLISNIANIADVAYNSNDNPLEINYSNSLKTNYTYNNSNFRVVEIETTGKQDLDYAYDNVGNVINMNDSIDNRNYFMEYDDLNRLIGTTISGSTTVTLRFIYDQIGNLRNVTGTYPAEYYYQDSRPHATSRVVYY